MSTGFFEKSNAFVFVKNVKDFRSLCEIHNKVRTNVTARGNYTKDDSNNSIIIYSTYLCFKFLLCCWLDTNKRLVCKADQ